MRVRRDVRVKIWIKNNIKNKVNCVGQECPTYTGRVEMRVLFFQGTEKPRTEHPEQGQRHRARVPAPHVRNIITIMAMAEEWPAKRRELRKAGVPHGDIGDRENQKRRGEIAEAMFLTKAVTMGFSVGVLWGDSDKYDLIVDAGAGRLRVQVKSAHRVSANGGGGYHVRAHGHQRRSYRANEIDLLVAYVVPENAWYVFPPKAFVKMKSMRLFPRPGKKKSKFEEYREAWGWFQKR